MLATLLAAMHAAAMVCAVLFLPGITWSAAACALLLASLGWHLRRDALLLARDSVRELTVHEDGRIELLLRGGADLEGKVLGSTFVSTALIVVSARLEAGGIRGIVLLSDSAGADQRRRLRVWLRHAIHAGEAGSAGP